MVFDSDFRKRHNEKYHADHVRERKYIPFENVDAVKNPFEVSILV
jgi:hypothetical protein